LIPRGVEVFVGLDPIDLRLGFDRLCGIAEERVGRVGRSGALFVFFGKSRCAIKVLFFDGSGLCIFYKRLDKGTYRLPEAQDAQARVVIIDDHVLDDLLDGISVEQQTAKTKRRAAAH
jgi:transposase